ncbi:MAG: SDR family NAD(P)-dependent oxidoreductase [Pseudomonadota bacterium]
MNILITGANRGIGKGLADAYQAQGHTVWATSRGAEGGMALDVTDPAAHQQLAAHLDGQVVDLLICNAGVYLDKGEALDTGYAPEIWAQSFAANVTGVFLTVQALLPNLRRAAEPKIAIISSQMGSSTRAGGSSLVYRSSKAAVLNLGLNLSEALASDNIAIGIYHPGWVRTDMGTSSASISVEEAVEGLTSRFAALSMNTTGCFENWDGRPHPI